jgi:hypothetical protein
MQAPIQLNSIHSTNFPDLSPAQAQVVAALAEGRTITAAADAARIHRCTVHDWSKRSKPFRAAINEARSEYEEMFRDGIKDLYVLALKTH